MPADHNQQSQVVQKPLTWLTWTACPFWFCLDKWPSLSPDMAEHASHIHYNGMIDYKVSCEVGKSTFNAIYSLFKEKHLASWREQKFH